MRRATAADGVAAEDFITKDTKDHQEQSFVAFLTFVVS
jgi:hypothetical protein